jgi:type II secretory pathway component PulJ
MALTNKIKGNTLPEVLIALCITAFSSTLAVVIYLNIQQSTMPFLRLKSSQLANKYLTEAIRAKNYLDAEFIEEGYTIRKITKTSEKHSDCLIIRILVFDINQKKLSEVERTTYAY